MASLETVKKLCEIMGLPDETIVKDPTADEPTAHEIRQHGRVHCYDTVRLLVGESVEELEIVNRCDTCGGHGLFSVDRWSYSKDRHFTQETVCPDCGPWPEDEVPDE
jgi:hypothetical protein